MKMTSLLVDIPEEYLCPITHDIMLEPTVGTDGYTYERLAIEEWITTHHKSPMTREHMTLNNLKPNYALRSAIERFRAENSDNNLVKATYHNSNNLPQKRIFTGILGKDNLEISCQGEPLEATIIAILDVSGSMTLGASQKMDGEGGNMSRLDLVKHSMKTLAAMLEKRYQYTKSSLAVISFSDKGKVVLPITEMNNSGLQRANDELDKLIANGGTNIWDGLRLGLEIAKDVPLNRNTQIILLTDGEPTDNYNPPRGIVPTLKRKMSEFKNPPEISCFGFGYSLDTFLLRDICTLGCGSYGYIPDCSMVGTVFINFTSNVLSTIANNVIVFWGEGKQNKVGTIQSGVSRLLYLENINSSLDIAYNNCDRTPLLITANQNIEKTSIINFIKILIEAIDDLISDKNNNSKLEYLHKKLNDFAHIPFMRDIQKDILSNHPNEGQLMKAVSTDEWYSSWGRNHLVSYQRALQLERCVNFKDLAIQHFAGDLFQTIQEDGNDLFCSLPPPVPSTRNFNDYNSYLTSGYQQLSQNPNLNSLMGTTIRNPLNHQYDPNDIARTTIRHPNMSILNLRGGGCFLGHCIVSMSNNQQKQVQHVQKGDILANDFRVLAIIRTKVHNEIQICTMPGGLEITPWHPVRLIDTEWLFPNKVGIINERYIDYVYDFVLENGHYAQINGWDVVTLGHCFKDNPAVAHPYFGTKRVIDDLKQNSGWEKGFIELDIKNAQRNVETGFISKIC